MAEKKEAKDEKTEKEMAEAVMVPLDDRVNRNSKDSVFCDLFSDPKYVLQLYHALHPEDREVGIDEITLVTLDHVLLSVQYNDLGFLVGNRLLTLVEAQSFYTANILPRFLSYLGDTYLRYIRRNELDVYGRAKIHIPEPELYVIVHEVQGNKPDEICLSTEFFGKDKPGACAVEVRAKILYGGDEGNIIDQYITFCRVFDQQVKLYGRTKKAIEETIRICKDQSVLTEYLSRKETEEVMSELFDKELSMRKWAEELQAESRAEGRILETVDIYRNEMEMDDNTIIKRLMKKFDLSDQDAESYVLRTA